MHHLTWESIDQYDFFQLMWLSVCKLRVFVFTLSFAITNLAVYEVSPVLCLDSGCMIKD
jgi:hypothetical protein